MKIEILNTDPSHPINRYLVQLQDNLEHHHSVTIIRSPKEITDGDLLFLVSCNEFVDRAVTERFKHAGSSCERFAKRPWLESPYLGIA